MAYNITLSSSMRSNLLSLRNIATQMSKTQNILSTGKKVNNAIDNASAYYQARSLTQRAGDLNSLLDSMSQGIQTIKAASEGLNVGSKLLNQVTALANDAIAKSSNNYTVYGDDVKKEIAKQATVVTNKQEFLDAINSGKETICVFGTIDLGEISETIQINNDQKIVGVEYFGYEDSDIDKFSSITATSANNISLFQTNNVNCTFADLSISYDSTSEVCGEIATIMSVGGTLEVKSMNVSFSHIDSKSVYGRSCIMGRGSAVINSSGNNYLNAKGSFGYGYRLNGATLNLNGIDNITTNGGSSRGIVAVNGTIYANNKLYIDCSKSSFDGFVYGDVHFASSSQTTFVSKNSQAYRITGANTATFYEGAKIAIGTNDDNLQCYNITENASAKTILISDFINSYFVSECEMFELNNIPDTYNISDIINEQFVKTDEFYSEQYQKIIDSYNKLIEDNFYQGVNLLCNDMLTITFNENRTHKFDIEGVDARSDKIGISVKEWKYDEDVKKSLEEIKNAHTKIRQMQEKLGNNLSIIQTRQKFAEALCDVLETGADDLVLADMNETSAEYLMLQTRQQLAVNSLSLASQAAQSVLKVF